MRPSPRPWAAAVAAASSPRLPLSPRCSPSRNGIRATRSFRDGVGVRSRIFGSPPIRSRFAAATASVTSSILLLMPGDSFTFASIASVLDRRRRRHGHPRGKLCPLRPPRSPFLVGHHQDASRSLGHFVHAVTSHQTCRRAIRRHLVGSPSRTPLRATSPREDAAPQDRFREPRELARLAGCRRAARAGIR